MVADVFAERRFSVSSFSVNESFLNSFENEVGLESRALYPTEYTLRLPFFKRASSLHDCGISGTKRRPVALGKHLPVRYVYLVDYFVPLEWQNFSTPPRFSSLAIRS